MERREHPRRGFWLPISASGIAGGFAVSHNASDNGLLVVCAAAPAVGTQVDLTFNVPPDGPHQVSVRGQIVRVGPNDEDPQGLWPYKAGIELERDVPELRSYLESLDTAGSG